MQPLATTFDEGRFTIPNWSVRGTSPSFSSSTKKHGRDPLRGSAHPNPAGTPPGPTGTPRPSVRPIPAVPSGGAMAGRSFPLGEAQALMQGESVESEGLPREDTNPEH